MFAKGKSDVDVALDAPANYSESQKGSEHGETVYHTSDSRRQIGLVSAVFL